jgi:hypothetical protein
MRTPLAGQLEPMRPRGPQCFVDWRYVRAGYVPWYARAERLGVWDPAPPGTYGQPKAPSGVRLQAQRAEKLGPTIPRDRPWEYAYNVATALHDGGVYRVWYSCVPDDHFEGHELRWPIGYGNLLCYAESDDGFTWRKPALGIAPYRGKEQTNIVYGRDLSPNGFHGGSVFLDPHAPDGERYKLLYMGLIASEDVERWRADHRPRFGDDMDPMSFRKGTDQARRMLEASGHLQRDRPANLIYVMAGAVSPDGLRWTALPEPLMVHFSDTLNTASWDPALGRYVGYFRTWRGGRRCVGRAETEDFSLWPSTPDTVLQAPLDRHPSDDVYTNAKTLYPGSGDTHLMFPAIYHRFDDSRETYLASSVDGVNWQWVPGGPVVERGPHGAWHGGDVTVSHGLVPLAGDRIAVPFEGYVYPHKYPRGSEPFGAPGWAVWPRGRLSALVADERGEFSTPELIFQGRRLCLNLKTTHAGEVLVELQGENGQPIPGYTFAEADPLVGDSLDRPVTWQGNADIGAHAGKPVSLAFRLRRAQLFAFEWT